MMSAPSEADSLSIYFFTGNFSEAYRRFREGEEQDYATHDEIGKLITDIIDSGAKLRIHSFMSPERKNECFSPQLEFVSLGAQRYDDTRVLREAVAEDPSACIIPHFPDPSLLSAVIRSRKRAMAVLASSYYRRSTLAPFRKWQLARLLNSDRFELVSNHCMPATLHLADMGVDRRKLIPWDIPHRYRPDDHPAKRLQARNPARLVYAGTVSEAKGVGDLIRAVAELRKTRPVECIVAGSGDVESMRTLAAQLGIANSVVFAGQVRNNQVFDLFENADVAVVPSRHEFPEGFPLTFFEAIASRTPIVCSDHPIFKKVIADREDACIFTAGDPSSLASAVASCLAEAELYAKLSRNAVQSWRKLEGTADWRTLLREWFLNPSATSWIQERLLDHG
jgi:glycosyltransferase involved in cell wall biosynthesis